MQSTEILSSQSGGEGILVVLDDQSAIVDGTHRASLRIPISTRTQTFTNAGCDQPDLEVVIEISYGTTHHFDMRLVVRPRGDEQQKRNFVSPTIDKAASVSFELVSGELVVKAQRPYSEHGNNDQFTMLQLCLQNLLMSTTVES